MLVKWGSIILSIVAMAGAGVFVLGGTLPDSCATATTERPEQVEMRDDAALAERLATLNTALARQDLSRAIYEWRDAYGLALRSRSWEAMATVGDAAVRVNTLMGAPASHVDGFRSEAHRAYIHALLRAQREQSREGVDRIADGLASLGETDMAAQARTLGTGR